MARAWELDAPPLLVKRRRKELARPPRCSRGRAAPAPSVCGISWYEAEAYARFAGEASADRAEWEKAASWDPATDGRGRRKRRFAWGDESPTPALCNFGNHFWSTTPVGSFPGGASAYGCLDMTGNVWEWTNDAFAGFPGFEAFPYPEYSETVRWRTTASSRAARGQHAPRCSALFSQLLPPPLPHRLRRPPLRERGVNRSKPASALERIVRPVWGVGASRVRAPHEVPTVG